MIALVTCKEMPDGDSDDRELPALTGGEWVVWDDPDVDWSRYDVALLRSPWDYAGRRDEFLARARSIPGRLINPFEVIEWNTDKTYLGELREAGLPVVPTLYVEPGKGLPLLEAEVVVKPTVSAGSRDTARFKEDEVRGARVLLSRIHASGRTAMVQPYVPSVDVRGETALLYFGGTFSHAIEKGPLLEPGGGSTSSLFAPEKITPREPTERERGVADRVIAWSTERFGAPLTYARVDLIEGPGGGPLLLELELTEPSLFFAHAPGAVERFAALVTGS